MKILNERQEKIKEELFPLGEIAVLDMKVDTAEEMAICLAYVMKQLLLIKSEKAYNGGYCLPYPDKVFMICRDMPTSVVEDCFYDIIGEKICSVIKPRERYDRYIKRAESVSRFLDILESAENRATIVVDFDIKKWREYHCYPQVVDIVRRKRLSLIYAGNDFKNSWNSEVVVFDGNFIRVYLNLFGDMMKIAPFKWKENGLENFYDLASLKFELTDDKKTYRLVTKEKSKKEERYC